MITFRPAITSEAKPLIGLYSESGCGKTWSSLLIARGFAGPDGRIGMLETEGGRGEAYADLIPGGYDVLPIRGSFAPETYGESITAAESAGLRALIIDSASHEWEGAGGVLAMAAANQAKGTKGVLVWQAPKMAHQRHFMGRLIATPIPLVIVCMRAKYPMEERKNDKGAKEWVRSEVLEPKQSDDILYEMFVHGWIDREHKFHGTKYTRPDFRDILRDGEMITLDTGRRLAAWASGGKRSGGATAGTGPVAPAGLGGEGREPAAEVVTPPDAATMRAASLRAIEQEREKIRPSAAGFQKVVAYFTTAESLEQADISELDDLLDFLRKLAAKDEAAQATLDQKILKRVAVGA